MRKVVLPDSEPKKRVQFELAFLVPLIGLERSHQAAAWCDGIARAQCNERSVSDTAPYQRPCRFANYKFATVRPSRIKKRRETSRLFLVPLIGLEPIRCRHRGILSPLRLPFRHSGLFYLSALFFSCQTTKMIVARRTVFVNNYRLTFGRFVISSFFSGLRR